MTAPLTLADLCAFQARNDPDRIAVIIEDQPLSYSALDAAIERAADGLAAAGVRHGDRIALMLPNALAFIAAFYGAMRIGAVAVPINPMYRETEAALILTDARPVLGVVTSELWQQARNAFDRSTITTLVYAEGDVPAVRGAIGWNAFVQAAPARAAAAPLPGDVAVLLYTSGTTGKPKGAMHSHERLLLNTRLSGTMQRRRWDERDRALIAIPIGHIYGLQSGLNSMFRVGASAVIMRRFDAVASLRAIERYRCTYVLGVPVMFSRWLAVPELQTCDLSSLRVVNTGTASLSAAVLDAFERATGVAISESYGLTEAGPSTHSNSNGPYNKLGSIGPPIPEVRVRLVDDHGAPVEPGEPGEIEVLTPTAMLGYWNDPVATADALHAGWLRTGDVATCDADGYYTLVDRLKDMISVNGFKVWPREVEEALATHRLVSEAAVIGAPDAAGAESIVAFIIPEPGARPTPSELRAHVGARLARYKIPACIELVSDLPRVATGKIVRRLLREQARARLKHRAPGATEE